MSKALFSAYVLRESECSCCKSNWDYGIFIKAFMQIVFGKQSTFKQNGFN